MKPLLPPDLMRTCDARPAVQGARSLHRPFFLCPVAAGFPNPCDDYRDKDLDANELLAPNPAATYYLRIRGHSMRDGFVRDNDIAVVDRSITPRSGHVVVATLDGEMLVKTLVRTPAGGIELHPANSRFPVIAVRPDQEFEVWGVVRWTLHHHLENMPCSP